FVLAISSSPNQEECFRDRREACAQPTPARTKTLSVTFKPVIFRVGTESYQRDHHDPGLIGSSIASGHLLPSSLLKIVKSLFSAGETADPLCERNATVASSARTRHQRQQKARDC